MRYTCVLAMTLMLAANHTSFAGEASPVGNFDSSGTPDRDAQIQLINPGPEPESRSTGIPSSGVAYRRLPSDPAAAQEPVPLASVNSLERLVRCPAGDPTTI